MTVPCCLRGGAIDVERQPNWAEFYQGWQARANLPDPSFTVIDESHAVFQAMYLDLAVSSISC